MAEYTTLEQVKIRLKQFHVESVQGDDGATTDVVVFDQKDDNPLLEQLIKQATDEVISRRHYPKEYTQNQISDDLKQYTNVIINVAVYDRSQAGESYMASYSENGVSRTWIDRNKILADVIPFVKLL